MILHLGVMDQPYADNSKESTGDVAEILENKYEVMQKFFDLHGKDIAKDLESSIAGALENTFATEGKMPENFNIFAEAMGNTEQRFRHYIDAQEHGIRLKKQDKPQAGGRKKKQYKKVVHTTPFIYSGLYRLNFRAWIE